MKTNIARPPARTHEGAFAKHMNPELQLRRSVMAHMLWESEFYEDGASIAGRIAALVAQCKPKAVAAMAVEAREKMKLRHVPLLLVREMARLATHRSVVAATLADVIQRPDELAEFLAIYWKDGRQPLSAQVKRGLASAFTKFDAYSLAKYNRDAAVKLRDVLFLCHAKPKDEAQAATWRQLVEGTLPVPDTWEVALSAGGKDADKKAIWERLLAEGKLGALALLRNLRNMREAKVSDSAIVKALETTKTDRVLPFRFIAAAKAAPEMEAAIDGAFLRAMSQQPKMPGKTIVVIDVSGSMYGSPVSAKSDMSRALAACALGVILREVCEEPVIYATAGSDYTRKHQTAAVPARRGIALADAIHGLCVPLGGGGIFLKQVMDFLKDKEGAADRIVIITDEQDCGIGEGDSPNKAMPFGRSNYIINVASAKNGVGYGAWMHIDGWSEAVVDYISQHEAACRNHRPEQTQLPPEGPAPLSQ